MARLFKPTIGAATRPLPPIPDGIIELGERSRYAYVAKKALHRALGDDATCDGSDRFGRAARADTILFQRLAGGLDVDGVIGPATWKRLGAWLGDNARTYLDAASPDSPRDLVVAQALWWVRNAALITYQQRRPMSPLKAVPRVGDCSESSTLCYRWAGLPDPNGNAYDGTGYTGTLIEHGRRIAWQKAKPADLVFYGRNGWPTHVAVVIDGGQVMSFGSTPPRIWSRIDYRSDVLYAHDYLGA